MPRIISISAKCSDSFYANLSINKKQIGGEYDGYVPDFFPGDHYGDYVQLEIDVDSGTIVNWKTPTNEELNRVFQTSL
jgi:hypothetical protein